MDSSAPRDSAVPRDTGTPPPDTSVPDTSVPPPNCGQPVPATGLVTGGTLTVAGEARGFTVNIPSTYDGRTRFPVVFAFHGDGGNGDGARATFNFEAAHEAEAIFIYPNGRGGAWDLDSWRVSENRDVQFIDALITHAQARYCVNAARIFAAGSSRGAYFANHIACHRGGTIRGVAAHSGGGPYGIPSRGAVFNAMGQLVCPGQPTPVLEVIGANDGLLNDARQSRDFWKMKNTCGNGSAASPPSPCITLSGCSKPVKYCEIPGLGHALWANSTDATMSFFAGL